MWGVHGNLLSNGTPSDVAQQLVEEYCIHSICEITSSVQSTHPKDAKHFNIKLHLPNISPY